MLDTRTQRAPRFNRSFRNPATLPDAPPTLTFDRAATGNLSRRDQVLFERFGQGPIVKPRFDVVHHAFERFAAVQPTAVAVEHLNTTISYGDLDRQANRLAARLTALGVEPGDNVALFLERSITMIVGILGILKAGAAYVPQDAKVATKSMQRHIIDVTDAGVAITTSDMAHLVPVAEGCTILIVDELMTDTTPDVAFIPLRRVEADDRCFILFTSGTTGQPNGVQVTHGNLTNIVLTSPGDLGMKPGRKVAQILSISFDMAAWEILGALGNGATLVIRGPNIQQTVRRVDTVIATPTILGTIDSDACTNVDVVAVAGEPCPRPLADAWSSSAIFYNSCGPTETTIINTAHEYDTNNNYITIGAPTPNNTVYVLDENRQPCKIGEIGEMWAGGTCVTAGYLANDELTAERYVPDPFLGGGRMMFRTRDLGRWTDNGELEHYGRTDDQVKIRGFRVELDSVSAVIESTPRATHAVTLKYGNSTLVAFVSPASVDVEEARANVEAELPYYCMPELIIAMDTMPLTSRGKVDKRALLATALGAMTVADLRDRAVAV
jgi:D-alanine--poly(phosphoribitol) ligase subunit 1